MTPPPGNERVRVEVDVSECVHYGAFRYGHGEYHPYETYITRLHRGDPLEAIRAEFIDFLLHYRPRHFGEALGVTLEREYPLWAYPWSGLWSLLRTRRGAGWHRRPADVPDIITHFSEGGIPRSMIEKEYGWLHGAHDAIARDGYRPEHYGHPQVRRLEHEDGRCAYLVLDGNHRISTLSAMGIRRVVVEYAPRDTLALRNLGTWWGVRSRMYTKADAAALFNAYFTGNRRHRIPGRKVPRIVESA